MFRSLQRNYQRSRYHAFLRTPFYRRFPYRGGARFTSADRRGAFHSEPAFFYNRIPKVANSTISMELAQRCFGPQESVDLGKRRFVRPSDQ